MKPMQVAVVILAVLAMITGALGMMASFTYLALKDQRDILAGASGFVAGSVLIAAGLISLALIAAAQKSPSPDDNQFRKSGEYVTSRPNA